MTDIERRHDLPRCPFCGQWPADAGEFYVCCVTDGCPMSKAGCVEIEAWCQRPLEREYDADLAHAREAYEYQARTLLPWKARGGYGNQSGNENCRRERIWFSPHCLQPGLFAPLDCADAVDHIPEAGAGPADETEEA
jgi:hypothetical protein